MNPIEQIIGRTITLKEVIPHLDEFCAQFTHYETNESTTCTLRKFIQTQLGNYDWE